MADAPNCGKTLLDIQQNIEDARYLVIAAELAATSAISEKREASAVAMLLQMAIQRFEESEGWLNEHRDALREGHANG